MGEITNQNTPLGGKAEARESVKNVGVYKSVDNIKGHVR